MFFSKRAFNVLSKSSRCLADKSFLLLFSAFVAVIVVVSRVCYLLFHWPWTSSGLSLHCYPLAASTLCGAHLLVRPRSPLQDGCACVPSFPSRQESSGRFLALSPRMPPIMRG